MSTQSKTGVPARKIELFSPTYFAACTLGGIIGRSSAMNSARGNQLTMLEQRAAQPTLP
jgi:hypothetical protein